MTVKAESLTETVATAVPADGGAKGDSVGVGASIAVNIVTNATTAEIQDGMTISGTMADFTIDAIGAYTVMTETEAGAEGGDAIGASVAIADIDNDTIARVGTGNGITATGVGRVKADHTSTVNTAAKAETAGKSVAVGVSVAVSVDHEDAKADLSRSLTAGGAVGIESLSHVNATVATQASAKGQSQTDSSGQKSKNADNEAGNQYSQNTGSSGDYSSMFSSNSEMSSSSSSSSDSSSESGSDSVEVAGAVGVNYLMENNTASIADGVKVLSGGTVTVSAADETDASSVATGTAYNLESDSDNVGVSRGH
jgi:hypothetical protein